MTIPSFPVEELNSTPHDWGYLLINEIELLGDPSFPAARVICEDDEGGPLQVLYCSPHQTPALHPYLAQLIAWRSDPYQHEKPHIPVIFRPDGAVHFFVLQALEDSPRRAVTPEAAMPTELAHQFQKAWNSLRSHLSLRPPSRFG